MKKMISFVLVLLLVFAFVACGGNSAGNEDSEASADPAEALTIGVVQTNANESDWRTANTKSFNEAFTEAGFETKMVFR